ncbi:MULTISPECIES: hypothetical protein [unclassified Microbacterium]|uniref:hypothetical protein n=1 Tax=unclassified Microbacterium TaxID=2609290 RepID=UPI0010F4C7AB|nr:MULTISPECIES: hypothetical protein [unclassified Microbacterium]
MKNPFSRKPVSSDIRPLALTEQYAKPDRSTTISNPDTRMPMPHSANRVEPHASADHFRDLVRQKVAALAASGALDQDNLQALSHEIGSWHATWRQRVEQDAVNRTEVAQLLLAQAVQDKIVCAGELTAARANRAEVADARGQILRGWGFTHHVHATPDSVLATPTPVIESRVRAVAAPEPDSPSPDVETTDSSVIDFPLTPVTRDQNGPTFDSKENFA